MPPAHPCKISDFPPIHPRVEPQRHRGTESAQSHTHHKHEDTKTRRHHKATIAKSPQITQMAFLETRARGEVPAAVERRPGTTGPDNRFGRKRPARCHGPEACPLEERRPRHSSSPVTRWMAPPLPSKRMGRRNRRAPGASAGGKYGGDGRLRPEWTCFPPGAVIARSPTVPPSIPGTAYPFLWDLPRVICVICVICGQIAMVRGLRVFVSSCLRCLCFFSVSLCLCGSTR